jgi:hypothetical protein
MLNMNQIHDNYHLIELSILTDPEFLIRRKNQTEFFLENARFRQEISNRVIIFLAAARYDMTLYGNR